MSFLLISINQSWAQNAFSQKGVDSVAVTKRLNNEFAIRDSMIAAMKQKRIDDSIARVEMKIKMQQYRDSLVQARIEQRKKDSIDREIARQKIIEDRRIRDSITTATKNRIRDSLEAVKAKADSIRDAQIAMRDSITQARKNYNDSVKLAREEARVAREALAKYKNSKQYKDSLAAVKQHKKDSIATVRLAEQLKIKNEREKYNDSIKLARENYNDSVKTARINYNDSVKTARTAYNDSLKTARDKIKDSIATIRKARMDSLLAVRKAKEKDIDKTKAKTKEQQEKALAIKIHEKKQEEWSNEKLLKRKWNLPRKIYQNTVTRYNYYYNARRKYNDATSKLTKNNKDDFTKKINLTPFDIEKSGSSVASDMDTVIKKSSFSTQIHDPRSKWFDNLYFLMGKASYTKNDFDGAIATFQFIANEYKEKPKKKDKVKKDPNDPLSIATIENRKGLHKLSHHPIRNEALIWLAKSYIMAEQYSEAQALISTLEKDKNFPKRNKSELFLTKANLNIKQENTEDAIAALTESLKFKTSKEQKSRTNFLLGQLYASEKNYAKSTEFYKKSIGSKTTPEMDFYTKLYMAENAAQGGTDINYAKNQLEKIINDPKYSKFKSQALNALAAIEAKTNIANAIKLYKKSIANPENKDLFQKAISFAELGKLYYNISEYELAKIAYDSASTYGSNPALENIAEVNTRKEVLTDVVNYVRIIREQDSLLALSKLSEKEQRAIAKKRLENIQKQIKEQPDNGTQMVALKPNGSTKSNWYFYNNALIQKGSADFKTKWGNRKLEDNWRRIAVSSNTAAVTEAEEEGPGRILNTDVNTLMLKIPKTPAQIDECHAKIMDAYYELGLTYYSRLSDYKMSVVTFDTLLSKYAKTPNKKQTYYAQYLNHTRLNQPIEANKYKNLLSQEFSQTELSNLANNPNYQKQETSKAKTVFDHYEQTYNTYLDKKYNDAITQVNFAENNYKEHLLIPKYKLVSALSYAGLKQLDSCKSGLERIITTYPNTEEQKRAQEILTLMLSSKSSEIGDTAIANQIVINSENSRIQDSIEAGVAFNELKNSAGKGTYTFDPSSKHYVMIFIKNVDGRTMALKSGVSDYNLLKHNVEEYATGLNMLTTQQGVLSVFSFSNSVFAKKYANEMAKEKLLFSQMKPSEYEIAIISSDNHRELLKTRDILGYLQYYKKNYK